MASIEEKEDRIKEAFEDAEVAVSVRTREDQHHRNLVHKVSTMQGGEEYVGEIVSSFEEPLGEEKLDFLVQSFPLSANGGSEDAEETYGDTERIE